MCLIELYKVTYSFHILFKFGAKITIYLCAFLLIFPMKDFILTLGSLSIQGMQIYGTLPIDEILCVKNGRAIVVCGFLMK